MTGDRTTQGADADKADPAALAEATNNAAQAKDGAAKGVAAAQDSTDNGKDGPIEGKADGATPEDKDGDAMGSDGAPDGNGDAESRDDNGDGSAPDHAAQGEEGDAAQPPVGSAPWYARDSRAFAEAYPDLDRGALFADPDFLGYAEGKVGSMPMITIYEGWLHLVEHLRANDRVQAARQASPGSLRQSAQDAEGEYYTLKQMQGMSSEYIEAHWDKVQRSLQRLRK